MCIADAPKKQCDILVLERKPLVVELEDTPDSKSGVHKDVRVQVPLRGPPSGWIMLDE